MTGGFYFRNPHTRGGVFRGPVVDGTPTLRVGDRVWATTGVEGAGGCPTIPIIDNVPDAAALAAVEVDPNCFTLYSRFPGGFTPQFGGDLIDYSVVGGLRGVSSAGFTWDASVNIGTSEVDQFIFDTVNASVGFDTPTSFEPGSYQQHDVNLNVDVSYPVSAMVNVAGGTEWRNEQFTIGAGGQPSWEIGPYAAQGFSSGSNGFQRLPGRHDGGELEPPERGGLRGRRVQRPWRPVDGRYGRPVRKLRGFRHDNEWQALGARRADRRGLGARRREQWVPGRRPLGSSTRST